MTGRSRLVVGLLGVLATAAAAHRETVGTTETRIFRVVNELPEPLYGPCWVVMQGGALGAVPVAGVTACALGAPRLGARLLVGGGSAWVAAKGVKRLVRRPRPIVLLPQTRSRGPTPSGWGYLSGHAAVATALSTAVMSVQRGPWRAWPACVAGGVALTRMYVGAHLPLDVAGGAALGVVVDAVGSGLIDAVQLRTAPRATNPVIRTSRIPSSGAMNRR